jgi:predicted acetyltransferase
MKMRVGDGLWVRLLDVGAALAARSYSAPGPIVFQVADDFCTWNGGRWKLEDGVAKKTRADADLACGVTALGSVYLGGFTFAQLVRGGRIEELKRGAAARADAMFRTDILPWCPEVF